MDIAVILEDDVRRIAAMRSCLRKIVPRVEAVFFEDAREMIAWLPGHRSEVVLISLDHDLPMKDVAGEALDCGTGRQVADYLASELPTCPVIVHSSNSDAAQGMYFVLKDSGWPCSRVYPCDDVAWVAEGWAICVRGLVTAGWFDAGGG